jgi:outer membrane protein
VDRTILKRIAGKLFILLVALVGAAPAAAQDPPQPAASGTLILSLEDALRIALGQSETVWVAEAGVMRALGNERIARSGYFPQISGTASYTRTLRSQFQDLDFGGGGETPPDGEDGGFEDLPFGRVNQYSLGLSLTQTVFDAGQTRARNRAAEARLRAAEIDVESAQAETLLDVTQSYFDALLADRLVTITEANLAQTEEILRQTQVARQVGDRSEFELLRARVARDNVLPVLLQRRTERNEAYLRLKQLLDVPLGNDVVLTTGVEDLPARFANASDSAPEARAPVRQAERNVEASQAQLAETRAQRLPSVVLSSRYAPVAYPENGLPEPDDFREDWTVTLSLSIPLLTWGRLRGNEMVAEGTLSEARARLEQTREAAELDARVAQGDLAEAQAVLEGNTGTVREAVRAYEIAQIRFREGISSQIELADARLLLEQAEVNRARALRDVQVARARLALLEDLPLGLGTSVLQPNQPLQQPQQQQTPSVPGITVASPAPGVTAGGFGPGGTP